MGSPSTAIVPEVRVTSAPALSKTTTARYVPPGASDIRNASTSTVSPGEITGTSAVQAMNAGGRSTQTPSSSRWKDPGQLPKVQETAVGLWSLSGIGEPAIASTVSACTVGASAGTVVNSPQPPTARRPAATIDASDLQRKFGVIWDREIDSVTASRAIPSDTARASIAG